MPTHRRGRRDALKRAFKQRQIPLELPTQPPKHLMASVQENLSVMRHLFGASMDLIIRELNVGGQRIALCSIEGLTDKNVVTMSMIRPLTTTITEGRSGEALYTYLRDEVLATLEQHEQTSFETCCTLMMTGFVLMLVDGVALSLCVGIQSSATRGVQRLETELTIRGSQEGFCEVLHLNTSVVRRKMKSTSLRFEMLHIGSRSHTEVVLCYMNDCCLPEIVDNVRRRLESIEIDLLLESAYLIPFLEDKTFNIFSQIGNTERPDVLCAKINEGRIAVMVDGTPNVLLVPYLFHEHFQSLDDYAYPVVYAVFSRILKVICFFASIFFPSIYVAIGSFHHELFPETILYNVAKSDAITPFPLMLEAILIFLVFEVMREAGLRLPKAVGGAVSIVGALVMGQAVVAAGLVGAPMIIVVALTAISAFVIPSLYAPMAILRLVFIIIGGTLGLYGVTLGIALLGLMLSSLNNYGIPNTSPLSPFSWSAMRDVVFRQTWSRLAKRRQKLQDMPGREKMMRK